MDSSFPISLPNCRSINRRDQMRKYSKPSKTRLPQAYSRMAIAL